jgi:putative molybdopterin biosynthesis protein
MRIREARLRRGLLQQDLAGAARISRQALISIELERATPSTPVALRLAAALGESVEELFAPRRMARGHLVVAGCDPALGMLAGHAGELPGGARLRWEEASSGAAFDALRRRRAHIAGVHLRDNASIARDLRGELIPFARWELGLLTLRGRWPADLAAARIVQREPGAGARSLLDQRLGGRTPRVSRVVRSHLAVARAIAQGEGDAGVATRAAAQAWGLDFTPWSEERFDLVIPARLLRDARVARVLDALHGRPFRRALRALAGYQLP